VLTAVLHRSQQAHVVDTPLTHYSLSGLLSAVTGTEPLGEARTAPSMAEAFGLPLAHG
jgi:phosphatidylinositol-3-phosphatase